MPIRVGYEPAPGRVAAGAYMAPRLAGIERAQERFIRALGERRREDVILERERQRERLGYAAASRRAMTGFMGERAKEESARRAAVEKQVAELRSDIWDSARKGELVPADARIAMRILNEKSLVAADPNLTLAEKTAETSRLDEQLVEVASRRIPRKVSAQERANQEAFDNLYSAGYHPVYDKDGIPKAAQGSGKPTEEEPISFEKYATVRIKLAESMATQGTGDQLGFTIPADPDKVDEAMARLFTDYGVMTGKLPDLPPGAVGPDAMSLEEMHPLPVMPSEPVPGGMVPPPGATAPEPIGAGITPAAVGFRAPWPTPTSRTMLGVEEPTPGVEYEPPARMKVAEAQRQDRATVSRFYATATRAQQDDLLKRAGITPQQIDKLKSDLEHGVAGAVERQTKLMAKLAKLLNE